MNPNANHHHQDADAHPAFLYALREPVPREFAEALYARLAEADHHQTVHDPIARNEDPMFTPHTPAVDAPLPRHVPRARRRQPAPLTLAALLTAFVVMGGLLLPGLIAPASVQPAAQPTPPPLDTLLPITADNAARLERVAIVGDGVIHNAAWSPDGRVVALGTSRGVYLHAADDLDGPRTLLGGQEIATYNVVYSGDGRLIAGGRIDSDTAIVVVWDAATGEVRARFQPGMRTAYPLGFTPDGEQLVVYGCLTRAENGFGCAGLRAGFWDVRSGAQVGALIDLGVIYARDIQISADAGLLALDGFAELRPGVTDRRIRLIDLRAGRSANIDVTQNALVSLALSPDGQNLAVARRADGPLELVETAQLLDDPAAALAEARDLLSTGRGITIVYDLHFLPDEHGVLVRTSEHLALYALDGSGSVWRSTLPISLVAGVWIDPDGARILTQSDAGWIQSWALTDAPEMTALSTTQRYSSYYQELRFTADSDAVYATGSGIFGAVWRADLTGDAPTTAPVMAAEVFNADGPGTASRLPMTIGRWIPSSSSDEAFVLGYRASGDWLAVRHNFSTGENRPITIEGNSSVIAFALDGSLLQLDRDKIIRRYPPDSSEASDYTAQSLRGRLTMNYAATPRAVFSPDGRLVIVSACLTRTSNTANNNCGQSELRAYDVESGGLLAVLDERDFPWGRHPTFSPDGRYLSSVGCAVEMNAESSAMLAECADYALRLWDLDAVYALAEAGDGTDEAADAPRIAPLAAMPGMSFGWAASAMLPDQADAEADAGLLLAMSAAEGRQNFVKVWGVDVRGEAESPFRELARLEVEGISSLAFSPDARLLVIGGAGMVEVWGVAP